MKIDSLQKATSKPTAKDVVGGAVVTTFVTNSSPLMRLDLPSTVNDLADGRLPFTRLEDGMLLWLQPDTSVTILPNATLVLYP